MGERQIAIDVEVHRIIEQNRESFGESENDILRRLLIAANTEREKETKRARRARSAIGRKRRRGDWRLEFEGEIIPATNLGDAYYLLLRRLAHEFPGFLEAFGKKESRSRRFVAEMPEQLYSSASHLARGFACTLVDGWYYDSNVSAAQVASRARIAAELCGLDYGTEVKIVDGERLL